MIWQAYIDDSLDDTGIYALAGYMASADDWDRFSAEWRSMLKSGSLNDRNEYQFKMSEMALSPERMSRVSGFHNVIHNHAQASIACTINTHDLERAIKRIYIVGSDQYRIEFDTNKFDVCMKFLLSTLLEYKSKNPDIIPFPDRIDFYFDDTTEKDVVLRHWDSHMKQVPAEWLRFYGPSPRFENDEVYLPIQAADFRAWWTRKWVVEFGPHQQDKYKYPFTTAAKAIPAIFISADEDKIVELLINSIKVEFGPDIPVWDKGRAHPNPDPPSAMSKLASLFSKGAKGFFNFIRNKDFI